jgi:hypothetical protein
MIALTKVAFALEPGALERAERRSVPRVDVGFETVEL